MVEKIAPVQATKNAEIHSHKPISKAGKEMDEKRFSDSDRTNVEHDTEIMTYGKLAGVEVGSPYHLLKQLVIKTLSDQNIPTLISTGEVEIDLGTLTPESAAELISEDGYFGVEKTSQRIVDFAINAFGADPAKLTQMKDAIEKGFQDAADAFGGALPEISHQTYAAVMEKLDDFAGKTGVEEGVDHG